MKKESRFISIYKQGAMNVIEVLVDRETGVNYLFRANGYAGGMTVLLNRDGNPVITRIEN